MHVFVKTNPVVYHVEYSDVTHVGKIVRQRHRNYAYSSDQDFVRRDWERSLEAHNQAHPVRYNRSITKGKIKRGELMFSKDENVALFVGSSLGMKMRQAKVGESGRFFVCQRKKKPAKIRKQRLKIVKEFPDNPNKMSVYKIHKVSKYPSVVERPKLSMGRRTEVKRKRQQMYPPVYTHYQPFYAFYV